MHPLKSLISCISLSFVHISDTLVVQRIRNSLDQYKVYQELAGPMYMVQCIRNSLDHCTVYQLSRTLWTTVQRIRNCLDHCTVYQELSGPLYSVSETL